MKSYVKGLWLIALSLIILSPEVRGQSFGDNPGNCLLNNLRRLPQPNPNWWEDKERMRMLVIEGVSKKLAEEVGWEEMP